MSWHGAAGLCLFGPSARPFASWFGFMMEHSNEPGSKQNNEGVEFQGIARQWQRTAVMLTPFRYSAKNQVETQTLTVHTHTHTQLGGRAHKWGTRAMIHNSHYGHTAFNDTIITCNYFFQRHLSVEGTVLPLFQTSPSMTKLKVKQTLQRIWKSNPILKTANSPTAEPNGRWVPGNAFHGQTPVRSTTWAFLRPLQKLWT